MVHQHFMLIPVITVAENIVLATEPRARPLLDTTPRAARVPSSRERYGLAVDPDARDRRPLGRPAAARRDPEGAVPRRRHPDPRRADGRADAAGGQGAVRDPARRWRQGKSIVFITHKLNEVLDVADRITVLRRASVVDTVAAAGATERAWRG